MLSTLVNHNDDLKRLLEKGYALSIDSNYLVVRDIPYLDNEKKLQVGAIVSILVFTDQEHVTQQDHQIFFCGFHPCELDGSNVKNLGGGPVSIPLASPDLVVQRSFSNKPNGGYKDWFEKIETYVNIICGPAIEMYGATPWTFKVYDDVGKSVFKYHDTLTSKAGIGDLTTKVEEDVIAIIGLGGTGAYLLDFFVKTPVKEIRGFDGDWYHVHNAFRSPGRLNSEELGKRKAEIYQNRYEGFREGINIQTKYILSDSIEDLTDVTFAFICVDKGSSRKEIIELLIKMGIPFIDVGMGLNRDKDPISGTLRTTYFPKESAKDVFEKNLVPLDDQPDDIYKNNIQISELNALNACIAMMKYKQIKEFYADDQNYQNILFTLDNSKIFGE